MFRYGAMHPLSALPIPRTFVIVAIPVRAYAELLDGNTEARCVRIERYVTSLVVICQIRGVEPSTIVADADVTPAPVIEAAHHLNWSVGIQLRNNRITVIRACIHIRDPSGLCVLSQNDTCPCQCRKARENTQAVQPSHTSPPKLKLQRTGSRRVPGRNCRIATIDRYTTSCAALRQRSGGESCVF